MTTGLEHRLARYDDMRAAPGITEVVAGVFFVTRREDACAIARDTKSFRQGGYALEEHVRSDDEKVLSETDPPLHTAVRKAFMQLITPRRVSAYEPLVNECFTDAIEGFAPQGHAELVADIAKSVPPTIIGRLSHLDESLLPLVRSYSADYIAARFTGDALAMERVDVVDAQIRTLTAKRRAAEVRQEDWLSLLLDCVDDHDRPLSDDRLTTVFTKDILVGGSETTSHVLSMLLLHLLSDRDRYEQLRTDRSLVPTAAEEGLRLFPTLPLLLRRANLDVEVGGTIVPKDAVVVVGLEAANHDPVAFAGPTVFDVHRGDHARKHVTFGHGAHLCPGAPLARLELVSCLNLLLDRLPDLRLAPGYTPEFRPAPAAGTWARLFGTSDGGPTSLVRLDVVF